jgi:polysaccharide chain length determinant protein (PEP-CTERM system associated)
VESWFNLVTAEIRRSWPFRWFAFYAAVILTGLAAFIAVVVPDQYVSRAQVYVNTETLLKPLLKGIAVDLDAAQQISVFQRTLLSDPNVEKVIRDIDMDLDINSPTGRERAMEVLRDRVAIEGVGKELFSIRYSDYDPVRARDIVQALLTIFIESNLGQSRTEMQSARDFVEKQIQTYANQLRKAEQQIAQFRVSHLETLGRGTYSSRLESARTELIEAELELQEAESLKGQLRGHLAKTPRFAAEGAPPSKIIIGDSLVVSTIDRINTLRTQLDALRLRYTDSHPDVIATKRELDALVAQYSSDDVSIEVAAVEPAKPLKTTPSYDPKSQDVGGKPAAADDTIARVPNPVFEELKVRILETEAAIFGASSKVERAKRQISHLESLAGSAPTAEAELADLTRDYEVMQKNYEELLRRREAARMSQAVDTSVDVVEFRVIDPPTLPAAPSGPNRTLILAVGTIAALLGGAFTAYLRANVKGAFVSSSDLQRAFALPVLGAVSRNDGFVRRVGRSADFMALLTGVAALIGGVIVAMLIMPIFDPVRTWVYRILEYVF